MFFARNLKLNRIKRLAEEKNKTCVHDWQPPGEFFRRWPSGGWVASFGDASWYLSTCAERPRDSQKKWEVPSELHWKLSSKITKMQRTRPKWWFGVWVWYRLMSAIYLLCPGQRCREDCNGTKWRNLFRWIAEQWNESCWRSYVLRTGVSRAIPRIASRENMSETPVSMGKKLGVL